MLAFQVESPSPGKGVLFMKNPIIETNDKAVAQALALLKTSDRVELKVTVQDSDHRSSIMALNMDVLDAEFRQVVFFDTDDLKLNRSGLVVRARRIRKGGDTVIKLRPVVPQELPTTLRRSGSFSVEVDALPSGFVCSGSLKGKADNSDIQMVIMGERPIRKLFSPEQRNFYKRYAPKGLDFDRLTPFGPINVAKLRFMPEGFRQFIVAEVWFYPDASRILELSTKCTPNETFQFLVETRTLLKHRGIRVSVDEATKTHKALQYFSRLHKDKRNRQTAKAA